MAMQPPPDFTNKTPAVNPVGVAELFQQKAQMEDQAKRQRFHDLLQAISTGQEVAKSMMTIAKASSQQAGAKKAEQILTETPDATVGQTAIPMGPRGATSFPVKSSEANQTRSQRLLAALLQANPQDAGAAVAKSLVTPDKAAPKPSNLQSKSVLVDGTPKEVLFDPDRGLFFDPQTRQQISGNIQPFAVASPYAEVRKQMLVQNLSQKMGGDLNELGINSNSPAGISAKRALFSKSALTAIAQAEQQPGGADKRQMAEIQMEVAKVLTGNGVMTNEQLNSLATRTAKSQIKNWEEWVSNNPTGIDQQAFLSRFKDTLGRQLKFHSGEIDKYRRKTMAKYANFERNYPEDFNAVLDQAGYDTAQWKKNKQLVPLVDQEAEQFKTLMGSGSQDSGLDAIAKTLGLTKKRGR